MQKQNVYLPTQKNNITRCHVGGFKVTLLFINTHKV